MIKIPKAKTDKGKKQQAFLKLAPLADLPNNASSAQIIAAVNDLIEGYNAMLAYLQIEEKDKQKKEKDK